MKTPLAKRQKKPKRATQTRAFVFALDVDEKQSASSHALRAACWEVRNKLTEGDLLDQSGAMQIGGGLGRK